MKIRNVVNKQEQIKTVILGIVFICYIALLIKMLFLSRISLLELFDSQRTVNRSFNLIPFYTIKAYILSNSEFAFANVAGNIGVFIPLGAYLTLFKKNKGLCINLLFVFGASLLTEMIQGLFGIGASDIDDVILNCLGGFIGILGYKLLLVLLRDEKKVRTVAAILSVIGLPVILYLLFMIQMRF